MCVSVCICVLFGLNLRLISTGLTSSPQPAVIQTTHRRAERRGSGGRACRRTPPHHRPHHKCRRPPRPPLPRGSTRAASSAGRWMPTLVRRLGGEGACGREEARKRQVIKPNIHSLLSFNYLHMQANALSPWPSLSKRPRWVAGLGWGCLARFGLCPQASDSYFPPFLPTHHPLLPTYAIRIDGHCTRGCLPGSQPGLCPDRHYCKLGEGWGERK